MKRLLGILVAAIGLLVVQPVWAQTLVDPPDLTAYRNQVGAVLTLQLTGSALGSVFGNYVYSDDSNPAVAAVHAGILAHGQRGTVRVEILGPRDGVGAAERNGVSGHPFPQIAGSYRFADLAMPEDGAAPPDPGHLMRWRNSVGETLTFTVLGASGATIWGDGIYSDDSPLGVAAVHAGVLVPGQIGEVTLVITGPQASFAGSTRNGVVSTSYGNHVGSYQILSGRSGMPAIAPTPVVQDDPGSLTLFRNNGGVHQFRVTGATDGAVWGDGIYTDDSSLATAAVHAGVLAPGQSGLVTVEILGPADSFTSATRNGVTSRNWGSHGGTFRFVSGFAGKLGR
jgi:hypothetical protein